MRLIIVALTSAALAAGLSFAHLPFAQAHQAQTGQDYTKFRQRNGMSCCSGHDCRPARYELKPDGSVVMFPEGREVSIPGDRVTQEPSDDGMGHWCGVLHGNGSATTFCAILPLHAASKAAPGSHLLMPVSQPRDRDPRPDVREGAEPLP